MTLLRPAYIYRSIGNPDPEWDGQEVTLTGETRTVGAYTYVVARLAATGEQGYVHPSELRPTRVEDDVPAGVPA
jgi:hypothetical protein